MSDPLCLKAAVLRVRNSRVAFTLFILFAAQRISFPVRSLAEFSNPNPIWLSDLLICISLIASRCITQLRSWNHLGSRATAVARDMEAAAARATSNGCAVSVDHARCVLQVFRRNPKARWNADASVGKTGKEMQEVVWNIWLLRARERRWLGREGEIGNCCYPILPTENCNGTIRNDFLVFNNNKERFPCYKTQNKCENVLY